MSKQAIEVPVETPTQTVSHCGTVCQTQQFLASPKVHLYMTVVMVSLSVFI
ncbi:hypothetical protein [Agaribacter marinus]|uniref:hypothetical protein n=1 Tax=Agaribacter marinus TaxID=1431249 RepID=UPI0024E0D074|nr:hypothetical protein [Agaribacter marinus]